MKTTFRFLTAGKRLTFLLCLMCLTQTFYALNPAKMLSQYKQVVFNTENGLSQNYVQSIVQTRDGYLWFGTQEGLVRYNGVSFKIFEKANTPSLKDNYISTILEDSKGRLWVGTNKGLHLYQNGEFTIYQAAEGLSKDFVTTLFEDKQGNLWIGTGSGGIDLMRDGKIIVDESRPKLPPDARVKVIAADASGDLWFGTSIGLFRLRDNQLRLFTTSDGLDNNSVRTIYLDAEKKFWIGTDEGLSRLENESFVVDARYKGKMVRSIKNDRAGALWISGEFGISRIYNGNLETLENRKDAPGGVYAILEDTEGSLWAATEGDGVWQFVDSKFVSMSAADGLINDIAYSFSQNEEGDVWISTEGGLSRFRQNAFDLKIEAKEELPKVRPSVILTDETGDLWIGSTKGLSRWRNGNFVNFKGSEILSKNSIQVLYHDPENNLLIGTRTGLHRYDGRLNGGGIIGYDQSEQLAKANIFSIAGSLAKGLWIGTAKGLMYLKDGKVTLYTSKDGLSNDTTMSLYEDGDTLWIGTFSGGLNRFKDGKFTAVTVDGGLFNNTIYSILTDDADNLWMTCNRGVFRVAKKDIDEFLEGKRERIESVNFGTADGMKSFECNGGYQPAALKTRDGKLWFPTPKGVAMIDPQNISRNLIPPPVHLESMLVDSTPIKMADEMKLPAETQRLEFDFAGLSFIAPKKVNYRYRLEGYDENWIEAGNQHRAFYTSLPYGDYMFRVIADNNDGVWNEVGDSYKFQIKPFFYQTWWFILIWLGVAAGIITAIHFWRVRNLQLRHTAVLSERTRIARELHDTLLQGFVGVSSQLSVVASQFQATPEIAERHLDVARKMIRHSVTEARRAVQNLRTEPDNKTFEELVKETVDRVTEGKSVETEVKISGVPFDFADDFTYQTLYIAEEAVVNAVKHSNAGKISVVCTYNLPDFKLEISDDGEGFETNNAFSTLNGHFGLLGMKERAEKVNGKLYVERIVTGGTKIIFENHQVISATKKRAAKVSAALKKKQEM